MGVSSSIPPPTSARNPTSPRALAVSRSASFVSSSVELHLVTAGSPVPVTARLAYDPSDPFAVSVSMRTDGGPTVEWVVSRDLLVAGLDAPAGDGDVGVWPSTNRGAEVVCVSLSSPDGQALLFGKHTDIAEFLDRT